MKHLFYLILLFALLSCSFDHETKHRMQHELQRVQAMNTDFIPLDTVSVMDSVLDYFELYGSHKDKMMANYLMGCVQRDKGNSPIALEYYRKATKFADTTDIDDVKTLSRIYGQIADVFNRQRVPQLEIKAEKEAVRLALKAKDTMVAINYYAYLAGPYHMMNKMDSALTISQTAINEFTKMRRKDLAAGFLPTTIDIYLREKNFEEVKKLMNIYEQESGFFKNGEVSSGHELYYSFKGDYFIGIGNNDSAIFYYRKLSQYPQLENLQAAYEGLARSYKNTNQSDSAIKYAFLFAEINDSISLKSSSQEIVKMQALYDYNENQLLASEKEQEAEHLKTLLFCIVIVVCIVSYLIYIYVRQQKKKKLLEIASANGKYSEILSQYNKSLAELKSLKGGFEAYQLEKQKEIEELKQMLSVYQSDNTSPEKWNIEQALLDSHIISHLHQSAGRAQMATNSELNDLKEVVSQYLPDFYCAITAQHHLTDKEVLVCMLSKLRFIPSEMVVLLGLTSQRITNIRSNINAKLFNEMGAQGLESNLRRF